MQFGITRLLLSAVPLAALLLTACGGGPSSTPAGGGTTGTTLTATSVYGTWKFASSTPTGNTGPTDMSSFGISLRINASTYVFTVPAAVTIGGKTLAACTESGTWTLSGKTLTSTVTASSASGSMCNSVGTVHQKTVSVAGNTLTMSDSSGTDAFTLMSGTGANSTYSVGGTLNGLAAGNSITLSNNGTSNVTLSSNGAFAFPSTQSDGTAYDISIVTSPSQPCTSTYSKGYVTAANVVANIICGPLPRVGFQTTGSLALARDWHSTTLLPDGKVLVAGGMSTGTTATAEL